MQKSLKISSFKEKFAAFSMKATDSKDLVKVNQILPIMQEYFGKSMNLACIKLMAYMLHALCVVQTVSLHKLASAMPTSVERDSNLRRIQRFIANYALNLDLVARMIFSLRPVKDGLVLSMDRQLEVRRVLHQYTHPRHHLQGYCLSIAVQPFGQARKFQLGRTQGYHGAVLPTFWT